MHNSEVNGAPVRGPQLVGAPASGPQLLLELGQLIVHSRDAPPPHRRHKPDLPSTSQGAGDAEGRVAVDAAAVEVAVGRAQRRLHLDLQLKSHVQALWSESTPLCIDVMLVPNCAVCSAAGGAAPGETLLLERWTLALRNKKGAAPAGLMTPEWLLSAVRSQLHFSQICAWRAKLQQPPEPQERQRRRSRETCNYKKLESNCDVGELEHARDDQESRLRVVYRLSGGREAQEFCRAAAHRFPLADLAAHLYLEVVLECLPRSDEIPAVRCGCALAKRRPSRDPPAPAPPADNDLAGRLGDLSLCVGGAAVGSVRLDHPYSSLQRDLRANYLLVDDRMHTPCSESGKHRCACDDEAEPARPDLADPKQRLRDEMRLRRLSSSESGEPATSIPILQAARFDRLRALGAYRTRAPLASDARRTVSVATQTDEVSPRCACGRLLEPECAACRGRLVRSEASYDLARASRRREREPDDEQAMKKLKCDVERQRQLVKRPKLKRALDGRIERVVSDRADRPPPPPLPPQPHNNADDMDELLLRDDDSVFAYMTPASPSPASDDEVAALNPSGRRTNREREVPSARATAGFRLRLDSAACMVFHARTGLPLTSSPAPLRRGTARFDYDDSISKPRHIRSALFPPASPPDGWSSPGSSPGSPAPPTASPPPTATVTPPRPPHQRRRRDHRVNITPFTGLLGSFEESALQGRLEPVATVHGFTAELGASGAFCPPHTRLPVTVFFYALGGTNAPYLGHINLGGAGYRVPRSGTVQVSLFNPHGTLVKMFVVLYELGDMPPAARTFLRQRTLYLPADAAAPPPPDVCRRALRYLIHLRFLTSKTGKLYLHTDIRIIVSRKADLDAATAHIPICGARSHDAPTPTRGSNGGSYELRSFTYAPDNPRYSPR